jgi:lytic murein transglycosylase
MRLAPALLLGLGLLAVCGSSAADPLPACLAALRAQAPRNDVSLADFDRFTTDAQLLERVVSSRAQQAEVVDAWWDYVPRAVDRQRVEQGRALLGEWQVALEGIEASFGVERSVFTAIWGLESDYGASRGSLPLLDVWVTRACTERRPLWRANVYASIRLLRDEIVSADDLVGSWGGAFGLTQFIPTSYEDLGADGDGDGRVDLVHSVPDALASTANHLARRTRWTAGLPAAMEVEVPKALLAGVPLLDEAWKNKDRRSLAAWRSAGLRALAGHPLTGEAKASLFFPTGRRGPAFLVSRNFDALIAYNRSTKYALSVALLAQRLGGAEQTLAGEWPTDDPGLGRDGIRALQERLLARGHDIGNADGIPGLRTRDAIRAEQQRLGWAEDGRSSERVLAALSVEED